MTVVYFEMVNRYRFGFTHAPACECTTDAEIICIVACNGVKQVKLMCPVCGRKGGAVAYRTLSAHERETARTVVVNHGPECERCGSTDGAEYHHWAPRHLFEDADKWPTGYLCRPCHRTWHRIVTPHLFGRGRTEGSA